MVGEREEEYGWMGGLRRRSVRTGRRGRPLRTAELLGAAAAQGAVVDQGTTLPGGGTRGFGAPSGAFTLSINK